MGPLFQSVFGKSPVSIPKPIVTFQPKSFVPFLTENCPMSREEASLFFRLLCRRYEKASLVLTSNKSFLDWGDIFGDQVLATAILDRLLHHATTVNIKGESYRLKEKRRAGLLESKALPPEEQEPLEVPT